MSISDTLRYTTLHLIQGLFIMGDVTWLFQPRVRGENNFKRLVSDQNRQLKFNKHDYINVKHELERHSCDQVFLMPDLTTFANSSWSVMLYFTSDHSE